jgi:hypothetical protein
MMSKKDTKFGAELIEAFKEVRAHRRGEIALPTRIVDVISAQRVKAIRTSLAKAPEILNVASAFLLALSKAGNKAANLISPPAF